jgi:hypothetical protein
MQPPIGVRLIAMCSSPSAAVSHTILRWRFTLAESGLSHDDDGLEVYPTSVRRDSPFALHAAKAQIIWDARSRIS